MDTPVHELLRSLCERLGFCCCLQDVERFERLALQDVADFAKGVLEIEGLWPDQEPRLLEMVIEFVSERVQVWDSDFERSVTALLPIDLASRRHSGPAWRASDAELVVDRLAQAGWVVLGGDVLTLDSSGSMQTCASWSCDIDSSEPLPCCVQRSASVARSHTRSISDEAMWFRIVARGPVTLPSRSA